MLILIYPHALINKSINLLYEYIHDIKQRGDITTNYLSSHSFYKLLQEFTVAVEHRTQQSMWKYIPRFKIKMTGQKQ